MKLKELLRKINQYSVIIINNGRDEIYMGKVENFPKKLHRYYNNDVVEINCKFSRIEILIDTFEGVLW